MFCRRTFLKKSLENFDLLVNMAVVDGGGGGGVTCTIQTWRNSKKIFSGTAGQILK